MEEYVATLLFKYNHPLPKKCQLSPFKANPIVYGAKTPAQTQTTALLCLPQTSSTSKALLLPSSTKPVDIGTKQASAACRTNDKITQLLYYCATYPNDGIPYRASNMILSVQSNAAYVNASKFRSRAGTHIMCSENDPVPSHNGPVLTITQIIKFFCLLLQNPNLPPSFFVPKK
eukprot:CCRYP_012603-RA/>CCRYP_012603-RA protein AED:0.34 eAED:0.42 QI:0/0/0/1/0/0/2/0/173